MGGPAVSKRLVCLAVAAFAAGGLSAASCTSTSYPGAAEPITIGTSTSEVNSLILVAAEQGYFADQGVELDHHTYVSGALAADDALNGKIDLAAGSEFAFAARVMSGADIRAVANICRSSIEYLVVRSDRGIRRLSDLAGKTIGVPLDSRPHFALDRYLVLHNIDASRLSLVDLPVNRSVEALANGEVDAVATWQPYINEIQQRMPGTVFAWPIQQDQPSYTLLICRESVTTGDPAPIVRFLKAIVDAEAYVTTQPEAARRIVQQALNYTDEYISSVWPDYRFSVSLEQSLVVAVEDEARWMMSHNMTLQREIPNFVEHIYLEGLRAAKPEAVNVIR